MYFKNTTIIKEHAFFFVHTVALPKFNVNSDIGLEHHIFITILYICVILHLSKGGLNGKKQVDGVYRADDIYIYDGDRTHSLNIRHFFSASVYLRKIDVISKII